MGSGLVFFTDYAATFTPAAADTWQDWDLSSYIPSNATGAIIRVHPSDLTSRWFGVRRNGDTANFYGTGRSGRILITKVDANRVCEVRGDALGSLAYYLVGYTDSVFVLRDTAVNITPGTSGSWQTVDLSSYVNSTATGVLLFFHTALGTTDQATARMYGSTDNRIGIVEAIASGGLGISNWLVGLSSGKKVDIYAGSGAYVYLLGYVEYPVTFYTNAVSRSTSTTGSWVDTAGTSGATAVILEVINTVASAYDLDVRKNGCTLENYRDYSIQNEHAGWFVGLDASGLFEQKIQNAAVDVYEMGYTISAGAMISESPLPPAAPYMSLFARPQFAAYTPKCTLADILEYEVRLGSNGTLGSFYLLAHDPYELKQGKVGENERIVLILRQGQVERLYTAIVENISHVEGGRAGVPPCLKLSGRSCGLYLARRNRDTDYSSRQIYSIMASDTDGVKLEVTELEWGDYIRSPGVTISTSGKHRSIANLMNELMIRGSTSTTPWIWFVCNGEHPNETKENVHFRERTSAPTPIVIRSDQIHSYERISSVQFLCNQIGVEYATSGLYEIRNNTASQTKWGEFYDYTYARYLTSATEAQALGDTWLSRTYERIKAISLTIPHNLFVEPNFMMRFVTPMSDRLYETGMVMHRGSVLRNPPESVTIVEAATIEE